MNNLLFSEKVAYFLTGSITAMNAKISIFVICVKAIIYFYYYIICMTEPLSNSLKLMLTSNCIAINEWHLFFKS